MAEPSIPFDLDVGVPSAGGGQGKQYPLPGAVSYPPQVTQPEPEIKRVQFDLEAAYQDNARNREIATLLAMDAGVDLEAILADDRNYTYAEIIDMLVETRPATRTEAVLEGVARGVTRAAPVLAGALAGAKAAAPLMPFAGPFAPAVPVVGGIIGGLGVGLWVGSELEDAIFSEVPISPTVRPWLEGGGVGGETLSFLSAPWAFPAKVSVLPAQLKYFNGLRKFWAGVTRTAKERPKTFLATEVGAGASAGTGAGIAEEHAPGQAGPRFVAEVVGSVLSPTNFITQTPAAFQAVGRIVGRFSDAGRKRAAARLLFGLIEDFGDDTDAFIKILGKEDDLAKWVKQHNDELFARGGKGLVAEEGIEYVPRSAAQLTGWKSLAAIEQSLSRGNAKYGREAQNAINTNIAGTKRLIDLMRGTKNPDLIKQAAEFRNSLVQGEVDARWAQALDDADAAVAKLGDLSDPEAAQQAGLRINAIVKQTLDDLHKQEDALWDLVPKKAEVSPTNILEMRKTHGLTENFAQYIEGAGYPGVIKSHLRRFGYKEAKKGAKEGTEEVAEWPYTAAEVVEEAPVITLGDVQNFRSQMNKLAQGATARSEFVEASMYGDMAEAARQDIDALGVEELGNQEAVDAFNAARTFTRQIHDSYTRSFGGKILRMSPLGERRVDPELLHEALMQGSASKTALRMGQLRKALMLSAERSADEGVPISPAQAKNVATLHEAEDLILRNVINNGIVKEGRVDPRALRRWVEANELMLKDFPDLRRDLSDVEVAETVLINLPKEEGIAAKHRAATEVFQLFLGDANVGLALDQALGSGKGALGKPDEALRQLGEMVTSRETIQGVVNVVPDAAELLPQALRDHVLDRAWVHAGGTSNASLNFDAFKAYLFDPIETGLASRMTILRETGVVSDADAGRLATILGEARKIQNAMVRGENVDALLKDAPQAIYDLVMRLGGSAVGSGAGKKVSSALGVSAGGQGIIQASAGIRFVQNMFDKLPSMQIRDIMTEWMTDHASFKIAMEEQKKLRRVDEIRMSRRMHAALMAAGFDLIARDPQELEYIPEDQYRRSLQNVPPSFRGPTPMGPGTQATVPQPMPQPMPQPQAMAPPPAPEAPPMPSPQGQPVPQPTPEMPGGVTPQRSQYAAIFPNDPISGLIRQQEQQGIAALMQQQMQGQQQA